MDQSTIEQIMDDAVDLVASGYDPQLCAERWPEHRQELQELLPVARELHACAQELVKELDESETSRFRPDWAALLADVPQSDQETSAPQPRPPAVCPAGTTVAPSQHSARKATPVGTARTVRH